MHDRFLYCHSLVQVTFSQTQQTGQLLFIFAKYPLQLTLKPNIGLFMGPFLFFTFPILLTTKQHKMEGKKR